MDSIDNKSRQDLDEAFIKMTIETEDTDSEEVDVHIIGIDNDPQSGIVAAYDYGNDGQNVFVEIIDESDGAVADDGMIVEE